MATEHHYKARTVWTGAAQGTTTSYTSYSRDYEVLVDGKPPLVGSADPVFRGDASRHSPEDLLLIALSTCHLLEYLYLCSRAGVHVLSYTDEATGTMGLRGGKMGFLEVVLRPQVVITEESDLVTASRLHHEAHDGCYIANSVSFPIRNEPEVRTAVRLPESQSG